MPLRTPPKQSSMLFANMSFTASQLLPIDGSTFPTYKSTLFTPVHSETQEQFSPEPEYHESEPWDREPETRQERKIRLTGEYVHRMASSSSNVVGVHYRVGKKIGEGSFGVIFEGTNLLNNQQVAIKFVCIPRDIYYWHVLTETGTTKE